MISFRWLYPALVISKSNAENSTLYVELEHFTDGHLMYPIGIDDYEKQSKSNTDIKSIILDASSISNNERDRQLTIISSDLHIESIYILGEAPNPGEEWSEFLKQFPKTQMFFDNEKELAVRWVLDISFEYRRMAMNHKRNRNESMAQQCMQRCLDLCKRLKIADEPN